MIACPICLSGLTPPREDDLSGEHQCRCGRLIFSEIGRMWIFKASPGLGKERVVLMHNGEVLWTHRTGRIGTNEREQAVLKVIHLARVNEVMES